MSDDDKYDNASGDDPPPRKGKKRGPPYYAPDEQTRRFVEALAGAGLQRGHIAKVVGINPTTLRHYYKRELETALAKNVAQVGQTLLLKAIGGPPPVRKDPNVPAPPDKRWKDADTTAAIFYLKSVGSQFGWSEHYGIQHSGVVGEYDLSKISDEELHKLTKILDPARVVGDAARRDRKT